MKTKIITMKGGNYSLVIDEPNMPAYKLFSAYSYNSNACYLIWDFRYTTLNKMVLHEEAINQEQMICLENYNREEVLKYIFFDFIEAENLLIWNRNDGILLSGCDRPYNEQKSILKHPRFVWSYASVREKLRELKNLYEGIPEPYELNILSLKIENPDLNPRAYDIIGRMKESSENKNEN